MFFLDARHGAEASGEWERISCLKELDKWVTRCRLHTYLCTMAGNTCAPFTVTWSPLGMTLASSVDSHGQVHHFVFHTLCLSFTEMLLCPLGRAGSSQAE